VAKKFYFSQLAARPLVFSGRTFRFLICSKMSGRHAGVYMTEDAEEIKVLDGAVAGKRGIQEIGESDYEDLKKKATLTLQSPKSAGSKPRVAHSPKVPPLQLSEGSARGAESGKNADADHEDDQSLISKPAVETLIRVERVASPKPFGNSERAVAKAVRRADAAKIRSVQKAVDSSP
jgi:hypothetical protein